MKRYKLKVDSPWGKKGDELNNKVIYLYSFEDDSSTLNAIGTIDPSKYSEIFEEIQEQSDEEWLSEWLLGIVRRSGLYDIYTNISSELIANGFDVKKLREKSEKEENT